jgi:hypothetical protein
MRKFLLIMTGTSIAVFLYLAYLGESVEAWTVIPWMVLVFMDQYKEYKDGL